MLCASPAGADGKARRAQLFDAGATADDVCQGGLGDCWLLSALACLATRPGAVRRAFVTQQLSPYGRYTLRLWDAPAKEWRLITVSDEFPCSAQSGEPLFTKPHGNERGAGRLIEVAVLVREVSHGHSAAARRRATRIAPSAGS